MLGSFDVTVHQNSVECVVASLVGLLVGHFRKEAALPGVTHGQLFWSACEA